MTITIVLILIISGVFVGFINTLSAGGTTISIALYLALGLPAQTANAINRVGVLIQNGFASAVFYRKHLINYKQILLYAIPVLIGSLVGSLVAIKLDKEVFDICLVGVLLLMIVFLCVERKNREKEEREFSLRLYLIALPLFFITGFYGGFVQTGTGFLLIAVVGTVLGYDLLKTTVAKNTIMFLYTIVAMIVFLQRGGIETKYWVYGLIHSIGNIIGSYIATRYALKKGSKLVKIIIICVIILTSLDLLGIVDFQIIFKNFVN